MGQGPCHPHLPPCTNAIFREKVSGARADRRELLKLLKALGPGDMVMVTRIDRLARSTFDLFAIVKQIVDAGGQFRSLAEPWADTATSTGRLMIAVLGGLADVERDLIRTRTAEGRSRAKARGQHMGRPSSSPIHRRQKPAVVAPKVRRSKNWLGATTSGLRRSQGFPGDLLRPCPWVLGNGRPCHDHLWHDPG